MSDFEIDQADAGSTEATTIPVNKLKKGGFALIESRPCRVVEITKSKTGKHGHAKAGIAGSDIFTGRRYEVHIPTSHDIEVPFVNRQDYQLINIEEKHTQLLALDGNLREDVLMPSDEALDAKVREFFDSGDEIIVTVITCGDESAITDVRKQQ